MRWKGRERSGNVEDRRGARPGGLAVGGGLGGLVLVVVVLLMGGDPRQLLQMTEQMTTEQGPAGGAPGQPLNDEAGEFVSVVLKDTEDVWHALMSEAGQTYREPQLVMFAGQVESACGMASTAVGPFYCPGDSKVYLDTQFFDELSQRIGAPGDFAQAYVIAHEVGHHVQNLMGTTDQVHRLKGQISEEEYNALSVRLELQADFFAGVWAHHAQATKSILEEGDIEEALGAATAIGDDRLQKQSRGYVVPESFTHGTSEQRVRWFRKGFDTGDIRLGDTFNARVL
jgi:predicted metalloprotease